MKKIMFIILSLLFCCVLAGCRTAKVLENSNIETRIEYRDKYHRDSIYIRDSVIIHEKGDTVFKDRWRTEWKDRIIRDTVNNTDTVYIEKEVFRDRSEPPNGNWEKIILLAIIVMLIYKFK